MTKQVVSLLSKQEISAIVNATHPDIFSVLGMHQYIEGATVSKALKDLKTTKNKEKEKDKEQDKEKALVVRAFLPNAQTVSIVDSATNEVVANLSCIDKAGLFEGKITQRKSAFSYRLTVKYPNDLITIDDPYRFPSLINNDDTYLFCEGTHEQVYQWMGSHQRVIDNVKGMSFVVWAPSASRVSVVGDFNFWNGKIHSMRKHPGSGLWDIFIPELGANESYKYEIVDEYGHTQPLKADPYAFAMQHPPETASLTCQNQDYAWQDEQWLAQRTASSKQYNGPVSIYEVHLGSWRRKGENTYLTYRELAEQLIPYVVEMGFTHLQLMPVSEFPFDGSWGYQPIGLFAPTSRFGSAEDFKYFVDCCHQANIGLLLDWVPGHFPTDVHGTGKFDGSCVYEHEDLRKGFHPDWQTLIYNYGRNEVKSYLISNANYWLEEYHIDGLRVDAVASMLYLDYSREAGQWLPNIYGGRENLEAIDLLQQVNRRVYANHPGIMMVAEESTAWPGVSQPVDNGGLGFGFKWNMGWMNDTLSYMERDPIYRQHHHNEMTFGLVYSFSENFVLPISHDEVVHGKGSMINKMPGDDWQKFANLRAYYGFMWTHPGKKLLFMGCEFAQRDEWNHDKSLDWHLLEYASHQGIAQLIKDLNHVYRTIPALHELDCDSKGFEWLDSQNSEQSILTYLRKGKNNTPSVLVVVNLTPTSYENYVIGVPDAGYYRACLNTDAEMYGGSNIHNGDGILSSEQSFAGHPHQIKLSVPGLSTMIFEWQANK